MSIYIVRYSHPDGAMTWASDVGRGGTLNKDEAFRFTDIERARQAAGYIVRPWESEIIEVLSTLEAMGSPWNERVIEWSRRDR